MKIITTSRIEAEIEKALLIAGVELPEDVVSEIKRASKEESGPAAEVLKNILLNLDKAKNKSLPLCQDTGMVWVLVEQGENLFVDGSLKNAIHNGVKKAYDIGYFRKSVVTDPVFGRENSQTNLPPVIHYESVPGDKLKISLLLKGFGSENCSKTFMLKPTDGKDAVVNAVVETMKIAGGSPCPPVVLGVGVGGTIDKAALLSKVALLRDVNSRSKKTEWAELEQEIYEKVNALNIGPGGLSGRYTTLGVMSEHYPTHIAGLPVAITVNCWADRKAKLVLEGVVR